MIAVRLLLARRAPALLLCAAALLMKLLVPAGYMIGSDRGVTTVMLCTGMTERDGAPMAMPMAGPGTAMPDGGHGKSGDHGRGEVPCAFSGLFATATGATDPIQLAALVAYAVARGRALLPARAVSASTRLRPPLRAPPAAA